jgi:ABC-type branched-subunit amino acid transport system substrate-binding protein
MGGQTLAAPVTGMGADTATGGYWLVAADGGIFSFNAPFDGSTGAMHLNQPIVGMAATPDGGGYWLVASDGGVFTEGDAIFHGSTGNIHLNEPILGMAATPDGGGYWLVASDGGIFTEGDAQFYGSMGGQAINKPIVAMAATPDGRGYWLVASDGGIFNFGDAHFYGSMGGRSLNKPIVGMAATPNGGGYWLVASDGGVFTEGDAQFFGSTGNIHLNEPIVGMAPTGDGGGYWLVARDGGVFSEGDAIFEGSTGAVHLNRPIVGMASDVTVPYHPPSNLTIGNFDLYPSAEAAYCTGTFGNGSSAPGVTSTTITVGNVSGLTGPLPGIYGLGVSAVEALFDAINSAGGICGRQLEVDLEDDQQSSATDATDVQDLIPQILAFVGSLSDADDGGVSAMEAAGVPDIGPAISPSRSNSSVYWSATGGSVLDANGRAYLDNTLTNGLEAANDLPSKVAIISDNATADQQLTDEYATLFEDAGVGVCYAQSVPSTTGSFGPNIQAMQSAGCTGVFSTMDPDSDARLLIAIQAANWLPTYVGATQVAYTPEMATLPGESAAQRLQVAIPSVPFSDANPAVQLYQSEMAAYQADQVPSEYGFEAWADAQMFVYALITSGHNPTRASLTSAMASVFNWTVDGAFGPYTPSTRSVPACAVDAEVEGSSFARAWPSSGLYCNGELVDVGPAS